MIFLKKSPIKCWLPALHANQEMDSVSSLSILGSAFLAALTWTGKEESEKMQAEELLSDQSLS